MWVTNFIEILRVKKKLWAFGQQKVFARKDVRDWGKISFFSIGSLTLFRMLYSLHNTVSKKHYVPRGFIEIQSKTGTKMDKRHSQGNWWVWRDSDDEWCPPFPGYLSIRNSLFGPPSISILNSSNCPTKSNTKFIPISHLRLTPPIDCENEIGKTFHSEKDISQRHSFSLKFPLVFALRIQFPPMNYPHTSLQLSSRVQKTTKTSSCHRSCCWRCTTLIKHLHPVNT